MRAFDADELEPAVKYELERLTLQRDRLLAACKEVLERLTKFEMDFRSQQILEAAIPKDY